MNERILWPAAGKYVVAVSGGADSMVLLDLMATADRGYELVVAHYDHGIRPESNEDATLVRQAAEKYNLEFRTTSGDLGKASEATARAARHEFLESVRVDTGANAIITAHHQDDLIETSLLNLARGTGRRGLAPMQDGPIVRPLLNVSRAEIREYAKAHKLSWNEDITNSDITNPRNFLRHELLAQADEAWRREYLEVMRDVAKTNRTIDQLVAPHILSNTRETVVLDRRTVRELSLEELQEIIASAAYRIVPDIELDERLVQELALFAKTGRNGTHRPIRKNLKLYIHRDDVTISPK